MSFTITDNFQETMSKYTEKYSIFTDLIFYGIIFYVYYLGGLKDDNHVLIKYLIFIFTIRYLFSYLTTIKEIKKKKENENDNDKINYQINTYLAIYTILVLLIIKNYGSHGHFIEYASIFFYTLFLSATNGNTVNNIFTVMTVYLFYTLQLF